MTVAFALINGMQLLQCVAPTPSERVCAVYSPAMENLLVMDDHGRFEVSCLFYGSTDSVACVWPHVAQLIVDGRCFDLGKLPGGDVPAVVITRFVATYPKKFELRVTYTEDPKYYHPDEALLVDEVRSLVDESLMPASHSRVAVYNRVKDLELYTRVTRTTSFKAVLASHPERLTVEYDHGTARISTVDGRHCATQQDYEVFRVQHEARIVSKLEELLQAGDLDFRVVFQKMVNLPEFKATLTGSTAVLSRFLLSRPDIFWYRQDAQHTTRVGLTSNHI